MPIPWTSERTQLLLTMSRDGRSDAEIARALDVTSHAVIGKRYRLDLFRIPRGPHGDAYTTAIRRAERERASS